MKLEGANCLGRAAAGLDVSWTNMGAFPLSLELGEGFRKFAMWIKFANQFKKIFKTQMDTSLNKAQHKQELLCR
jgi:hypothetical protein